MCNPCTCLDKYRCIEFLWNLISKLCIFQTLCRVSRLQHRKLCSFCIMTGILLILGRMHARIVCYHNHHTGVHTNIRNGEQRVCCHVESYMLHSAKASLSCKTCTEGNFHGYLLIWCPFTVHLIIFRYLLCNLSTWCSGIAGNDTAASLVKSSCNCGVPQH